MDDRKTTRTVWPFVAGGVALPLLAVLVALPQGGHTLLVALVAGVSAALALLGIADVRKPGIPVAGDSDHGGYAAPANAERR